MPNFKLRVNGRAVTVDSWIRRSRCLYVLRNSLGLHGRIRAAGLVNAGMHSID